MDITASFLETEQLAQADAQNGSLGRGVLKELNSNNEAGAVMGNKPGKHQLNESTMECWQPSMITPLPAKTASLKSPHSLGPEQKQLVLPPLRQPMSGMPQPTELKLDDEGVAALPKFTGLPEFDETKIPELPPLTLNAEEAAQLEQQLGSGDELGLPIGSPNKYHDVDLNSDSDGYLECLSVNSELNSAEPSDLETYRSALNDPLMEAQLSHVSDSTLANSSKEGDVLASGDQAAHNLSFEPMDVDDINATMEILKDVLEPDDHKLLKEHMLSEAMKSSLEPRELLLEQQRRLAASAAEPPLQKLPTELFVTALVAEKINVELLTNDAILETTEMQAEALKTEISIPALQTKELEPRELLVCSPSKIAEAAQEEAVQPVEEPARSENAPPETAEAEVAQAETGQPIALSPVSPAQQLATVTALSPSTAEAGLPPIVAVQNESPPIPTHRSKTAAELEMMALLAKVEQAQATPRAQREGRASPSFPIKLAEQKAPHFPRSPHAPVEPDEMPYLEPAVIEKWSEPKPSGTVAAKASPEKAMENCSYTLLSNKPSEGRRTFSLSAPEEPARRTFNVLSEERHSRRTFTCVDSLEQPTEQQFEPMDVDMDVSYGVIVKSPSKSEDNTVASSTSSAHTEQRKEQQSVEKERSQSPPLPTQLKRRAIHESNTAEVSAESRESSPNSNASILSEEQKLSAKEQATHSASNEKDDDFVDYFGSLSPVGDDMFKAPQYTSSSFASLAKFKSKEEETNDEEFNTNSNNLILNSSDFDYLYTKGNNNAPIDRSSLLLKFDPLLGTPVPVSQHIQQQGETLLGINNNINFRALSPTVEEHELSGGNQTFTEPATSAKLAENSQLQPIPDKLKHAKMSIEMIDAECNKSFENSTLNTENKANNFENMDELEKKIKNEVTKSEDIEKKLKESEQREEALIKRITDKDKTIKKLNGVIEAYEKAIAELITEKEDQEQNFERQLQTVQADRDSNYHHLTSLETTFSDLHVKYEKSKEMTTQLKQIEDTLMSEKKQLIENLRLQEQRYEKMKSHAMQQLEIANNKLDGLNKEHTDEVKKLKALLKKEEISRVSIAEQLQQKSRENADLLKICEELIYDKDQGGTS